MYGNKSTYRNRLDRYDLPSIYTCKLFDHHILLHHLEGRNTLHNISTVFLHIHNLSQLNFFDKKDIYLLVCPTTCRCFAQKSISITFLFMQ